MFCYKDTGIAPDEQLLEGNPYFKEEAKDSIWTISDITMAPVSESFIVYSTMSGILHLMRKNLKQNNVRKIGLDPREQSEDNNQLKPAITQDELRLICEDRAQEESTEPSCVLLRNKLVYSLCMLPSFENEIWCGVKFGKLLLYDLER